MRLCLCKKYITATKNRQDSDIWRKLMKKITLLFIAFYTQSYPFSYSPTFDSPNSLFGEPRITKNWLTTIDFELRGGHGICGRNTQRQKVNVLNIYGCENFHMLAKGVPDYILNCNPNGFINNLWEQEAALANFGQVCIAGKFATLKFDPTIIQNLVHGLFLSLNIPIQNNSIKQITYYDQTTKNSANTPEEYFQWQAFINNLECNLQQYGVQLKNSTIAGLSDLQLFGGWSYSHEDTTHIDFLDFTVMLGVNIPTGKNAPENCPFCISLGCDGHVGIPMAAMVSIGLFDWLTFGLNAGAIWFKDKTNLMAMKTATEQSGWIRLARGYSNVHKGATWHIDPYVKFDHLIGGFSLILGLSHDHANRTCLSPCDTTIFNPNIVNCDVKYLDWNMSTFHFVLEFDSASFKHSWAPRLAFTIDKPICGKRIFDTAMFGAHLTFDIDW